MISGAWWRSTSAARRRRAARRRARTTPTWRRRRAETRATLVREHAESTPRADVRRRGRGREGGEVRGGGERGGEGDRGGGRGGGRRLPKRRGLRRKNLRKETRFFSRVVKEIEAFEGGGRRNPRGAGDEGVRAYVASAIHDLAAGRGGGEDDARLAKPPRDEPTLMDQFASWLKRRDAEERPAEASRRLLAVTTDADAGRVAAEKLMRAGSVFASAEDVPPVRPEDLSLLERVGEKFESFKLELAGAAAAFGGSLSAPRRKRRRGTGSRTPRRASRRRSLAPRRRPSRTSRGSAARRGGGA